MKSIKELAQEYEPPQTLNISDLEVIPTDLKCEEKTFNVGKDNEFTILVTTRDNKDYRVPQSVLSSLKLILVEKPKLKFFKVKKEGEGIKTKYTVIPIE